MRVRYPVLLAIVLIFAIGSFAGTAFQATTTLTAQTSNNTSAADTFTAQVNGNLGASNISKVSIHTLLYPGATTRVYVHLMPWFGFADHMNVGYNSDDPAQVQRQVADLVSRGMDGVIADWYGQGTLTHQDAFYSQVVQDVMHEAELRTNFNFAVMDDLDSVKACSTTAGCDITQMLINDLTYAYNTWENSPAYLHYNNQPVVYFFGQEFYPALDWTRVRASVPGNPMFIFRNIGGFTYAQTNGAFSWVAPETVNSTDPMALIYLDNFDKTALSRPTTYATISAYKGFNDVLASWGSGRLIQQQCGQTWLASLAEAGKFYSASKQALGIQLVTWNDYEEGTELETGIDNCVTVSATVSGTVASWSITGQANTIDHYTVYVSQDGENLMWLADEPVSASSLDLGPFQLNSGNYTVFVQAVGKPYLTNKISAGAALVIPNQPPVAMLSLSASSGAAPLAVTASSAGSFDPDGSIASTVINFGDGSAGVSASSATHTYTAAGNYTVTVTVTDNLGASAKKTATVSVTGNQPFSFTSSNTSATVAAGQTATYSLSLDTKGSGFTGTVSLVCNGAPAGTTCAANPASASFSASTVSVPVNITVTTTTQAKLGPVPLKGFPFLFAAVFAGLFCGANKRARKMLLASCAAVLLLGMISCGGGASSSTSQPVAPRTPTSATLTVNGTSGSQSATASLSLTITH